MRHTEMVMSPVVGDWFARRTSGADQWHPDMLVAAKGSTRVSVVIPARDEEATVGHIVAAIRREFVDRHPLVDEVIVVDSRSSDGTVQVAAAAGATVVSQEELTAGLPPMHGKGDALWAGLSACSGDVVAFVDADVYPFDSRFVSGLLGPLLDDPTVAFVKGFYHRPLTLGNHVEPDGGGRVTELMARPLLNLFWPDLSGFVQPLAGECAGRRAVLAQLPFVSGYGVEIAMLIDLLEVVGLDALAQVDLGERAHRNQSTEALGRMATQILLTAWSRMQRLGRVDGDLELSTLLTQFRRSGDGERPYLGREVVVSDVGIEERLPLVLVEGREPALESGT